MRYGGIEVKGEGENFLKDEKNGMGKWEKAQNKAF